MRSGLCGCFAIFAPCLLVTCPNLFASQPEPNKFPKTTSFPTTPLRRRLAFSSFSEASRPLDLRTKVNFIDLPARKTPFVRQRFAFCGTWVLRFPATNFRLRQPNRQHNRCVTDLQSARPGGPDALYCVVSRELCLACLSLSTVHCRLLFVFASSSIIITIH